MISLKMNNENEERRSILGDVRQDLKSRQFNSGEGRDIRPLSAALLCGLTSCNPAVICT